MKFDMKKINRKYQKLAEKSTETENDGGSHLIKNDEQKKGALTFASLFSAKDGEQKQLGSIKGKRKSSITTRNGNQNRNNNGPAEQTSLSSMFDTSVFSTTPSFLSSMFPQETKGNEEHNVIITNSGERESNKKRFFTRKNKEKDNEFKKESDEVEQKMRLQNKPKNNKQKNDEKDLKKGWRTTLAYASPFPDDDDLVRVNNKKGKRTITTEDTNNNNKGLGTQSCENTQPAGQASFFSALPTSLTSMFTQEIEQRKEDKVNRTNAGKEKKHIIEKNVKKIKEKENNFAKEFAETEFKATGHIRNKLKNKNPTPDKKHGRIGKKSPLAYAPQFPNNNDVFQQQNSEEEKEEISIPKRDRIDNNPGAFAVQPGGSIIPAGQTLSSIFETSISSMFPSSLASMLPQEIEENVLCVPHATLVKGEEEDFDNRMRKMIQSSIAVEVVQTDNEEIEIIATSSTKRKRIATGLFLILLLIVIVAITTVIVKQKKNYNPSIQPTYFVPTLFETITLYLRLGKDSNAIGFKLSCGIFRGDVMRAQQAGTFVSKPGGVTTEVFDQIPVGRECSVEITNVAGTGLQPNGLLRIHQGKTISYDSILVEIPGNFTDKASRPFNVELITSQVPSISPTAPTGAPSLSLLPSQQQTHKLTPQPTQRPTPLRQTASPFRTPRPTPTPTSYQSATPTFHSYSIIIDIGLDLFPLETGWSLACNGILKASFPPESYLDPKEEILMPYDVEYNDECLFTIVDRAGDGICCSNGPGYYKITVLADTITTLLQIEKNGEFGAQSQETFKVG